jgi:two-component system, NarL family, invasion response regulator UvrY
MNQEAKIRLLCVDDHPELRKLFELLTRDQPDFDLVGSLDSAEGLEDHIASLRPDVVVLDLSMPGRSPLDALQNIRNGSAEVRFLVSSAYDSPEIVDEAMRAGAHGFIVKGGEFDILANAIRRVARNETVLPAKSRRSAWNDR